MDIFKKIENQKSILQRWTEQGHGYFVFPKLEGAIGPRMMFREKAVLNWSIHDYLGFANNPEIRQADTESIQKWGIAYPMGTRITSGQTSLHETLEQQLAEFVEKEESYLLNFGFQGMVSIIDTLCGKDDVVVYDIEAHARIIDGMRLCGCKRFVFLHNDMQSFEKQLQHAKKHVEKTGGGILVIVEGISELSGSLSVLDEIVKYKSSYYFRLLVDDAHGFGIMGENGKGTPHHYKVNDEVDIYFATLDKAMACLGAFVAGDEMIIKYLRYKMRSQIYAKSLPMVAVEGQIKRLEYMKRKSKLRDHLWKMTKLMGEKLHHHEFNIGSSNSPIIPVCFKHAAQMAGNLVIDLRENYNIFCPVLIYPVSDEGDLFLQFSITAMHTNEDIDFTIKALCDIRKNLQKGVYTEKKE